MPVYMFEFEAEPGDTVRRAGCGGAYVVCWVQRETAGEAELAALGLIEEGGWIVTRKSGSRVVSRNDYSEDSSGLPYFEQCLIDGEVAVFHAYPLDDVDPETPE